MSTLSAKVANPPKPHDDVVIRVQSMLQETLEQALENLQALDRERAEAAANQQPKIAGCLQALEKRLQSVQAAAAETDLVLADGEKVVREYMNAAERMRQRLAEWAGRSIG